MHRLDRPYSNQRIDTLNDFLASKENSKITFVEHNATFRSLRKVLANDGLHLSSAGKKQVAKNLMLVLELGTGAPQQERTRWAPRQQSAPSGGQNYTRTKTAGNTSAPAGNPSFSRSAAPTHIHSPTSRQESGQVPSYPHVYDRKTPHWIPQFPSWPSYLDRVPTPPISYPPWPPGQMGYPIAHPWGCYQL